MTTGHHQNPKEHNSDLVQNNPSRPTLRKSSSQHSDREASKDLKHLKHSSFLHPHIPSIHTLFSLLSYLHGSVLTTAIFLHSQLLSPSDRLDISRPTAPELNVMPIRKKLSKRFNKTITAGPDPVPPLPSSLPLTVSMRLIACADISLYPHFIRAYRSSSPPPVSLPLQTERSPNLTAVHAPFPPSHLRLETLARIEIPLFLDRHNTPA